MKSTSSFYTIAAVAVIALLFLVYRFGFSNRFYNLYTQSTLINLSKGNHTFLIEKHKNQKQIIRLELTFKGKLSDNITLNFATSPQDNNPTVIRLKEGDLDASFLLSWPSDLAYISIENPSNSTSCVELEYQFITN
jgi:hypothetical protein